MSLPRTLAAAGVTAVLGLATAATAGTATACPVHGRHVAVPMSDAGFTLPEHTQAGWVTFTATTTDPQGHQLEGFRTRNGATPEQVVDDIKRAVSFDQAT